MALCDAEYSIRPLDSAESQQFLNGDNLLAKTEHLYYLIIKDYNFEYFSAQNLFVFSNPDGKFERARAVFTSNQG